MVVTTESCRSCGYIFAVYKGRQCPYCLNYFCNKCIMKHEGEQEQERESASRSLKIRVVNLFGLPWRNAAITLTPAEGKNRVPIRERTDEHGTLALTISMAWHIVRVKGGNFVHESILNPIETDMKVKLPSIFGIIPWKKSIPSRLLCSFCRSIFKGPVDLFHCHYCSNDYCSKHRLPEEHNCKGKTKSLASNHRVIYSKGRTTVISK